MTQQPVQPIFILSEDTKRTTGKDAQSLNIAAAKAVAETVRTTLGPKGMDKMIVDSIGDITVTNDGVTILEEMDIQHPAAKMVVEVAKTQEREIGDGTTTAVVLAGELLKQAESLLEMDIHPTMIAKGYRKAADKAIDILSEISKPVTEKDKDLLKKIAMTAMTGKGAEDSRDILAETVVNAVLQIAEKKENGLFVSKEDIEIEKRIGGSIEDTQLIDGIVLDKERVHPGMPKRIEGAKIALIDSALEIKNTEIDAKINITDPEKFQTFLAMEEKMLKEMVDQIVSTGANVVICQKGIDDMAQHFLAKHNILAVRRVSKSDMERVAKATGGRIITRLKDLTKEDLGEADVVEEEKIGEDGMIFIKGCPKAKAVTILVRGGTEHVVEEIKRALDDAIGDITSALRYGKVVAGAGAIEIELAMKIRKYAEGLKGREQMAVKAFADALEIIPRTLAENSGLDPIDVLTDLRASHDKGERWAGIDVFSGKVIDAWKEGVIEPLQIKTQAISSATEVAIMILRIDDVIAGTGKKEEKNPSPAGGYGGYGGYGGGF